MSRLTAVRKESPSPLGDVPGGAFDGGGAAYAQLASVAARSRVHHQFSDVSISEDLRIAFISFGFKYGVPLTSDIVFDVRFLPNPYFIPDLRPKTGLNDEVRDYVLSFDKSKEFIAHATNMLSFLIPEYHKEGKRYLTVAIGCTGGKHRSVSIARNLTEHFKNVNIPADLRHRDIKETSL